MVYTLQDQGGVNFLGETCAAATIWGDTMLRVNEKLVTEIHLS